VATQILLKENQNGASAHLKTGLSKWGRPMPVSGAE
ncbi:MAG: hypothetical protein ACI8VW_000998, partial [bacterium]